MDGAVRARLIPVKGIGSSKEAEERATSALLAVMGIVRPYSKALLDPLGASRAERAQVDCYTEVRFKLRSGADVRPDGLIRVSYGKQDPWVALVEVKTGDDQLNPEQIKNYLEVARDHGFNGVLTISNELEPVPGAHPSGIQLRANSRVALAHLSWTRLLSTAVTEKEHRGVSDPEQAWILDELIRYLEHPRSGALSFEDMGGSWTSVRDAAKAGTMTKSTAGADEVVARWSQLIQFTALRLGRTIGTDVQLVLSRAQKSDGRVLHADLLEEFCGAMTLGRLSAALRIPGTVGDISVLADLRAEHVVASVSLDAPEDKGARGQVGWLVRQLRDETPDDLMIEAWPLRARQPSACATLAASRQESAALVGATEATRFVLSLRRPMGRSRKDGGKSAGFVESVVALVDEIYKTTVQHLRPYVAPAPRFSPRSSANDQGDSMESAIPIEAGAEAAG